jgi:hypothetical protein
VGADAVRLGLLVFDLVGNEVEDHIVESVDILVFEVVQ